MSWLAKNRAVAAILLAVSLLTARWIWLLGDNWDFGFTYESAARISDGQAFGRDFFVTVPPLASYTEAIFVRLLHQNLWAEQIHLFLWWIASLAVGYLIVRRMVADQLVLATGTILAAILSVPSWSCGLVYNYLATTLVGLVIYFQLLYLQDRKRIGSLALAGLCAGLGILAKQNVGTFTLLFFSAFLVADLLVLSRRGISELVSAILLFGGGAIVGFGFPVFLWSRASSLHNVLLLLFKDGVSGKGGIGIILARAIPRVAVPDLRTASYYRFVQIGGFLLIFAMLIFWCWLRLRHLRAQPASNESPKRPMIFPVIVCLALCSFFSLFPLPSVAKFGLDLGKALLIRTNGFGIFWGQLFYLLAVAVFLIAVLGILYARFKQPAESVQKSWPIDELFILLGSIALGASITTSSLTYITFALPVIVPILIYELKQRLAISPAHINFLTIFVIVTFYLYPGYTTTFQPLERLPDNSPFSHLYGTPTRSRLVDGMWENITPRIQSKRTLWLSDINIGPASAYGAKFSPNVIAVFSDTHSPRVQEILFQNWNTNLPDCIVRNSLMRLPGNIPAGSRIFSDAFLTQWLTEYYTNTFNYPYLEMWGNRPEQFEVWEKR